MNQDEATFVKSLGRQVWIVTRTPVSGIRAYHPDFDPLCCYLPRNVRYKRNHTLGWYATPVV